MQPKKQKTDHWLERTVEESTGLWSRIINYRSELIPEMRTVETLGKFLTEDKIRHETWGIVADYVRRARRTERQRRHSTPSGTPSFPSRQMRAFRFTSCSQSSVMSPRP